MTSSIWQGLFLEETHDPIVTTEDSVYHLYIKKANSF